MKNRQMLKKMSVKCAAAILAAGLMMSSAGNMVGVAGACSVAVYASELGDSGEGGSGSGNQSGEDDQSGGDNQSGGDDQTGGDEESGSDTTLDEEEDPQGDGTPSVGGMRTMSPAPPANEGEGGGPSLGNGEDPYYTETNTEHLAENPSGHTIGTNNAIIDTNNGTIGDVSINEETGEYVIDHDTGNYHIIHDNNGTVYYNDGDIKWNNSEGLVVENGGLIRANQGTIKVNLSTTNPVANYGTIEKNMEGAQVHNMGGRVEENSGVVYNYDGTVGTNTATGTVYFNVTINPTKNAFYRQSGLSHGEWLGQTGSTQGTATLIFTPVEGYEIVSISGWDQNISVENGVWTVGLTSGANISIQVNVVEKKPEPEPEKGGSENNEGGNGSSSEGNQSSQPLDAETLNRIDSGIWNGTAIILDNGVSVTLDQMVAATCAGIKLSVLTQEEIQKLYKAIFLKCIMKGIEGSVSNSRYMAGTVIYELNNYLQKAMENIPSYYTEAHMEKYRTTYVDTFLSGFGKVRAMTVRGLLEPAVNAEKAAAATLRKGIHQRTANDMDGNPEGSPAANSVTVQTVNPTVYAVTLGSASSPASATGNAAGIPADNAQQQGDPDAAAAQGAAQAQQLMQNAGALAGVTEQNATGTGAATAQMAAQAQQLMQNAGAMAGVTEQNATDTGAVIPGMAAAIVQ